MEEEIKAEEKSSRFQGLFGAADRTKDGKIKSEYPAWYFDPHKDELENSIEQRQRMIDNDLIPNTEKNIAKERLNQEQERLEKINTSRPNLEGKDLDEVVKIRKDIGVKISDAMFKRSEMEKGIADAHEEARRLSTPCVKLAGREVEFAKACDVPISNDGKVTRLGAEKTWKIASKLLGENSNTEILRKG